MEVDFVTDATKIAVQKISETQSERDLLHLLVDTLCDPAMNEIGGAFYSGEGFDMGEAAKIALNRFSRLPQEK